MAVFRFVFTKQIRISVSLTYPLHSEHQRYNCYVTAFPEPRKESLRYIKVNNTATAAKKTIVTTILLNQKYRNASPTDTSTAGPRLTAHCLLPTILLPTAYYPQSSYRLPNTGYWILIPPTAHSLHPLSTLPSSQLPATESAHRSPPTTHNPPPGY
ncbi:hypothetical protein Clim_1449 [Chlorobium limicola DSM 245]|uniref:Uncharacterized protein n=1 Tax=Chlorobium limicola (strain DSM 245 / NBRC 103803 / 6330) TaxID=290315 RepID=B3ED83_CHLL2|nr:hypothetical protein Clim_1449 [Chlorobium limicola DSM 245]